MPNTPPTIVRRGGDEEVLTYDALVELLKKGVGIDVESFDKLGNKTLRDLHKENEEKEVILIPHPLDGGILRCALSVKVLIQNPTEGMELHEVERHYPRTGRTVPASAEGPRWSMRETQRRNETPHQAAVRGLWEELELRVDPKDLVPHPDAPFTKKQSLYPSTVYHGIRSLVTTEWFVLTTDAISCREITIIKDGPTEVILRPSPIPYFPRQASS